MAHTIGALKRNRQNETRRVHNHKLKALARTKMKGVRAAVDKKDGPGASKLFVEACQALDKGARHGVFHANFAARHKSQLAAVVAKIAPTKK